MKKSAAHNIVLFLVVCWLFVLTVETYLQRNSKYSIINVMDYGADSSGENDNANAFDAAVAHLPALGGEVDIPAGLFRLARPWVITKSNVHIRGAGIGSAIANLTSGRSAGGTTLIGDLRLASVIQEGVDGLYEVGKPDTMVVNNLIESLTVTRADGTPPVGSTGIDWHYYNYAGEYNTLSSNSYYSRSLGANALDTSIHFDANHIFAFNASRAYWQISHSADTFVTNMEMGRNKGELFDPAACMELKKNAQSLHWVNVICIPRGPSPKSASVILATGLNDVNGIYDFTEVYTENCKYMFTALDRSGNGDFSELKITGGNIQASEDTFHVAPGLHFYRIAITGATLGPRTTLPNAKNGTITGSLVPGLTVNGSESYPADWTITGNATSEVVIKGSYSSLIFTSNTLKGPLASFSNVSTSPATEMIRNNMLNGVPMVDKPAFGSSQAQPRR